MKRETDATVSPDLQARAKKTSFTSHHKLHHYKRVELENTTFLAYLKKYGEMSFVNVEAIYLYKSGISIISKSIENQTWEEKTVLLLFRTKNTTLKSKRINLFRDNWLSREYTVCHGNFKILDTQTMHYLESSSKCIKCIKATSDLSFYKQRLPEVLHQLQAIMSESSAV